MIHTILKHSHSGLRWILLFFIVAAVISAFVSMKQNKNYGKNDKLLHLGTLIVVHIQLLIGFILYFIGFGTKIDFSQMANSMIRFYTVEHSLMMILAAAAVTIGYSKSKKISNSADRFKIIFYTYLIAVILIFLAIPWPFRSNLGAAWF